MTCLDDELLSLYNKDLYNTAYEYHTPRETIYKR